MLTEITILKTRQWFHDNSMACIEEVKSGKVKVNNPEAYFQERMKNAEDSLNGVHDHTFTFRQRAEFIQNGTCTPLLP